MSEKIVDISKATKPASDSKNTDTPDEKPSSAVCLTIGEFLQKEFPPREIMLAPWLTKQSLSMIYAWRGIGKSWLALGIGYALSCGGSIIGWKANERRRVLYIDGELPAPTLQHRLSLIVNSFDQEPMEDGFRILTPDLQPRGVMPNLSSRYGQEVIDQYAEDRDLIVVDNLATLCRNGKENEGESWLPVQEWALRHRSQGRSVLFIHHSGKGGQQRGTSRREDVLDTVISLRRPPDYEASESTKFELHFEKTRNLSGDEAQPLEIELKSYGSKIYWNYKTAELGIIDRIEALASDGASREEIAAELDLSSRYQLRRYLKKANESGRKIVIRDSRKKGGNND